MAETPKKEILDLGNPYGCLFLEYKEEKPFFSSNTRHTLSIRVTHPLGETQNPYDATFSEEWKIKEVENLNSTLVEYSIDAIDTAIKSLGEHLNPEVGESLEGEVINALVRMTSDASILSLYAEHIKALEESEYAQQIKEEKHRLQEHLGRAVQLETRARYKIAVKASRNHGFNVTRADIEKSVVDLFDPNDNLQNRPLPNPLEDGLWERHVRSIIGDGPYTNLFNIENDLDHIYMEVCDTFAKNGPISYERAFVETHDLEYILDTIERETEANVGLLKAFKKYLKENKVDYQDSLDKVKKALAKKQSSEFGSMDGELPKLSLPRYVANSEGSMGSALTGYKQIVGGYLKKHKSILVVSGQRSFNKSHGLYLVRSERTIDNKSLLPGSILKINEKTRRDGLPDMTVVYRTPGSEYRGKSFTTRYLLDTDNYLPVGAIKEVDDSLLDSYAEGVVDDIVTEKSPQLRGPVAKNRQFIQDNYPYLNDKITFRERFGELMKERFRKMYEEHS